MIAKIWKKVLLVILLIACLYNIISKLVYRNSLEEELNASVEYIQQTSDTADANK